MTGSFDIAPLPRSRRIVIDTGRAAARRHSVVGLLTVDITEARRRLRRHPDPRPTLTAFVVASVARAASEHPEVHAVRDLRNRLWTPHHCDVNVMVEVNLEDRSFPMNHVLRSAETRAPADLSDELRRIKDDPTLGSASDLAGAARWYFRLPGPIRHRLIGLMHRLPRTQQRLAGTIGITSVGMFGRGAGFGIAFQVHTLDVVVGGIDSTAGDSSDARRERLHLTLMFDHDVVDGAPAARFAARLRRIIERAEALGEPDPDLGPGSL
jgi:pyruvate/2-oxoglutarate dehydrogenase complex dihydrolipoamide acyltransferase (E2) component